MSSPSRTSPEPVAALLAAAVVTVAAALPAVGASASGAASAAGRAAACGVRSHEAGPGAADGGLGASSTAGPAVGGVGGRAVFAAEPVPAAPLPISAVLAGAGETTLVVDLGAEPSGGQRTVTVTSDGAPRKARLLPVVSAESAVSIVVDASAEGAASLPSWLSAGARFSLGAPARTRTVVIADREPAAVVAGPLRGPSGVVRALGEVRAGGGRDTAAALTLAVRQFPGTPVGRRVVLLYTTAPGAGGLSGSALAERFRAAGVLLVVVGTTDPDRYWSGAAAATGGFFAPAGEPVVVSALDQVETTLSGRYLVRFATPSLLPARVSVTVAAGDLALTGETVLGEPPPADIPANRHYGLLAGGVAALLALVALVTIRLLRRRRSRAAPAGPPSPYAILLRAPPPTAAPPILGAGPPGPTAAPPVLEAGPPGPAAVPPVGGAAMRPVARGRAEIPKSTSDD